jgi:hypothetical protein
MTDAKGPRKIMMLEGSRRECGFAGGFVAMSPSGKNPSGATPGTSLIRRKAV